MNRFETIVKEELPESAIPVLDLAKAQSGFVPNFIKGLAASPELVSGYNQLATGFDETPLTPPERQMVLLTASRANECGYDTAVHSVSAEGVGLDWDTIERIRSGEPLANERYESLRHFTDLVARNRGAVSEEAWTDFFESGYGAAHAFAVILGVTMKTLTNSVNELLETPLDEQFSHRSWSVHETEPAHA